MHEALLSAGVQFVDRGDGSIDLETGPGSNTTVRMQVKAWSKPLGPAQVARLAQTYPSTPLLLITPSISDQTLDAVANRGWSWITDPGTGAIRGELSLPGGGRVKLGGPEASAATSRRATPRGRKPWQWSAIVRHILLGAEWVQADLVEVGQVTQPRVSQVLNELLADGLVTRTRRTDGNQTRWVLSDYDALFDRWLKTYPGPGGSPTYWYGLGTIAEQVAASIDQLRRAHPSATDARHPVASGDAAADFLAPVRRSRLAVVYSPWGADLSGAGLTPAPEETATLKLVVPSDSSVWPHWSDDRSARMAPNAPFGLADPVQVTWDLLHSGRPDGDQAAAAVRRALGAARAKDFLP